MVEWVHGKTFTRGPELKSWLGRVFLFREKTFIGSLLEWTSCGPEVSIFFIIIMILHTRI